jgi:hypothetical protein
MIGDWIDKVEYPQLPAMTDDKLVSFFEQAQFARLGTFNEDGTIHIAPIHSHPHRLIRLLQSLTINP